MSADTVVIRAARAADCPSILRLFKELAEYEGMPHGVLINANTLEEDGFGNVPFYKCMVAEETSGKATGATAGDSTSITLVGYVLYFYAFAWEGRTLYMEDIYVTPSYRAKGLGTKLWTAIMKLGLEAGARSCRFCVLDWNAPSIAFYKSRGAQDVTATKGFHFVRIATRSSLEQLVARDMPEGREAAQHIIRPAVTNDLPAVMGMKGLLAAEAGLDLDTQLTLEELTAGLSSTPPTCHVVVAEGNNAELVGFALFSLAYSTWQGRSFFFQDLFVKSEFRKSGLGTRLVKASFQSCLSLGCSRCDFIASANNASAIAYYQKLGAVDHTKAQGWLLMFMDKEAMVRMVMNDGRETSQQ